MRFTLTIECDNDVFAGVGGDTTHRDLETARVLERVARRLRGGPVEKGSTFDSNGNKVGSWAFSEDAATPAARGPAGR